LAGHLTGLERLAECLPTFIDGVQVHILDDTQRDRGWLENASPPSEMAVEELPLGPLVEVPTTNRDRRSAQEEFAK
jgi:hypothetical protein